MSTNADPNVSGFALTHRNVELMPTTNKSTFSKEYFFIQWVYERYYQHDTLGKRLANNGDEEYSLMIELDNGAHYFGGLLKVLNNGLSKLIFCPEKTFQNIIVNLHTSMFC